MELIRGAAVTLGLLTTQPRHPTTEAVRDTAVVSQQGLQMRIQVNLLLQQGETPTHLQGGVGTHTRGLHP